MYEKLRRRRFLVMRDARPCHKGRISHTSFIKEQLSGGGRGGGGGGGGLESARATIRNQPNHTAVECSLLGLSTHPILFLPPLAPDSMPRKDSVGSKEVEEEEGKEEGVLCICQRASEQGGRTNRVEILCEEGGRDPPRGGDERRRESVGVNRYSPKSD